MFERCDITGTRFTIDKLVTFEISHEGLKISADEPVKITLPWTEGGMEFSEWIGGLLG